MLCAPVCSAATVHQSTQFIFHRQSSFFIFQWSHIFVEEGAPRSRCERFEAFVRTNGRQRSTHGGKKHTKCENKMSTKILSPPPIRSLPAAPPVGAWFLTTLACSCYWPPVIAIGKMAGDPSGEMVLSVVPVGTPSSAPTRTPGSNLKCAAPRRSERQSSRASTSAPPAPTLGYRSTWKVQHRLSRLLRLLSGLHAHLADVLDDYNARVDSLRDTSDLAVLTSEDQAALEVRISCPRRAIPHRSCFFCSPMHESIRIVVSRRLPINTANQCRACDTRRRRIASDKWTY